MKFLICEHCGNEVEMVKDIGVPLYCCNNPMTELIPNTSDGAAEKHVPVVRRDGDTLIVELGENAHPMDDNHLMEWVAVETEHGCIRRDLHPGDETTLHFRVCDCDKPLAVYAYCNLHGLWMSKNF